MTCDLVHSLRCDECPQCLGDFITGKFVNGQSLGSYARIVASLPPEGLVAEEGDDEGWFTWATGGAGNNIM